MFLKDLVAKLRMLPDHSPVEAIVPGHNESRSSVLPVTRVAQHDRSDDDLHDEQPVELFTGEGDGMSVAEIAVTLERYNPAVFVRIGVELPREGPDDPGNVRCLDIETVGLGGNDGMSMTIQLLTEPWQSQAFIVRRNGG